MTPIANTAMPIQLQIVGMLIRNPERPSHWFFQASIAPAIATAGNMKW